MTEVNVHVVAGFPLVRLTGPINEKSGAELAAKVMSAIHYMTEDPSEYPRPMSLVAPRISSG